MEIIQKDSTKGGASCVASLIAASLLILGGLALLVYYLAASEGIYAMPVWQFTLYALSPLAPIVAGGMWFGAMYRRGKGSRNQWIGGGLAFGLLLMLVGLFMLGFATDAINMAWRPVFVSWQMLLIVVGVWEMCKGRGHVGTGLVAIFVGYFFLMPRIARILPGLVDLPDNFISIYWPALLIAGGAAIVIGMLVRPHWMNGDWRKELGDEFRKEFRGRKDDSPRTNHHGRVDYNFIFSGADQVFLDQEFNGGEINVIFGGMTLDLRNTHLPEGISRLEINTVFGGVSILAPDDWDIELKSSSIFGGFRDNRRVKSTEGASSRLIVDVKCVFGGGEIK